MKKKRKDKPENPQRPPKIVLFIQKILLIFFKPILVLKRILLFTGAFVWILIIFFLSYVYFSISNANKLNDLNFSDYKKVASQKIQSKLKKQYKDFRWTPLKKVNRDLLYSIVLSEDSNFFKHQGVNYDALINALGQNILRRKFAYGASTISQQVVKNLFLNESKSIHRKLTEILMTNNMEDKLTKNQILELYFNIAAFGPEIIGVRSAASYYFKKKTDKINAAEGAFLAVLLPSPRKYHYTIFQNKYLSSKHRRKILRILKDMLYLEYISPKRFRKYKSYNYF